MSPAEPTTDQIREYTDNRQALAALHKRLTAADEHLNRTRIALRTGRRLDVEWFDAFKETLDDYRAVRKRCADLHQNMGRYGRDGAVKDLSEFPLY